MTTPFVFGAGANFGFKGTNAPSLEDQIEELEVREARLQNKLEGALSQIEYLGGQRDKAQKVERVARDVVKQITAEWKKLRENTNMADAQLFQELKDSNGQLTTQVNHLEREKQQDATRIDGLYIEIRELRERLDDNDSKLRTANEKRHNAERNLSETKNENERELKKLREKHEHLQVTIEKLNDDVEHAKDTAAHNESNLNRAYAENQNLRDAHLATIKAKDELEAKKLEADLLNQDLQQQWQEDAETIESLTSQLEEIHTASAQSENFQGDIERLTDILAERYRTIIVKDERIAQLETQLQKQLQRNLYAEEAANIPIPMSPYDEAPPSSFAFGNSLDAELNAAADEYDLLDDEHYEHLTISSVSEVVEYVPIDPRQYDLTIGVNEIASYSPVEAVLPKLSFSFSEVGHVSPVDVAVPRLSVSVSELGRVMPVGAAVPELSLRVNEIGHVTPVESSLLRLSLSVNEVGHVMPVEASAPRLSVSMNEVGSLVPIEAAVPNLTHSINEVGHVIPVEAASPKLSLDVNEVGNVMPVERAPSNLAFSINESAHVTPIEPALPTLSLSINEIGNVTPIETALPSLTLSVNEVGHVMPVEADVPDLSLHVNEVGSVGPVDAAVPNLIVSVNEVGYVMSVEAAPLNLSLHVNEIGNVGPIEAASPELSLNINEIGSVRPIEAASSHLTLRVNEIGSVTPVEAAFPDLNIRVNEVGHVTPVEPAARPDSTINVNETVHITPIESVFPRLAFALKEVGHVASIEPASLPDLTIDVNETVSISPVESISPKLTFAFNETASVMSIEPTSNTTSTSAQTDAQDLTTEILRTPILEISPIAPLEATTSTAFTQTEASKLCSIVIDAASVTVAPVEVDHAPASEPTITPIMVTHELNPLDSPISGTSRTLTMSNVSHDLQTPTTPENIVPIATAPNVLARKPSKLSFWHYLLAVLVALLAYYCTELYNENQAWRHANGVGSSYSRGGSYSRNGAFGNGRYLFNAIPLAMDIGGSPWSEQIARYVSIGITSFENWAGISHAVLY